MANRLLVLVAIGALAAGCTDDAVVAEPTCTEVATQALEVCLATVNDAQRACYSAGGTACGETDATFATALAALDTTVRTACVDGDFGSLEAGSVTDRLVYACQSEAASLAWRTFGGPQGAVLDMADETTEACLMSAHETASRLVEDLLTSTHACLANQDCSRTDIDPGGAIVDQALSDVTAACGDLPLEDAIALTPQTYVDRAVAQVDCLAANSASGSTPSVSLSCGPSNAIADPERGEYLRVELPADDYGTFCGDGSDYSFHIRLAPEGSPLDRVIIGLQGGGVCFFEDDCSARFQVAPDLFTAADDEPPTDGIMSNDPEVSPFADWTKIYLPYCNQDVFIGGGLIESFDDFDLHRFGAVNTRVALRAARDILWAEMDADDASGYRPQDLVALFGGWSAGSYGTMYNYHWVLDDLLWQRTAAFPDAGLGLDNGGTPSVRTFGAILVAGWMSREFLPPYCFTGDCAVGPDNFTAMSPRLGQVPEQQILALSNQRDETQSNDSFFSSNRQFINALRTAYCETKDLNGIHWYLTSVSDESVHVVTLRNDLYEGEVAGISMRDWLADAIANPSMVVDRAENGDFATVIEGVEDFDCELP